MIMSDIMLVVPLVALLAVGVHGPIAYDRITAAMRLAAYKRSKKR
jgi:hypothetical protein